LLARFGGSHASGFALGRLGFHRVGIRGKRENDGGGSSKELEHRKSPGEVGKVVNRESPAQQEMHPCAEYSSKEI
jgi:hypothetical protein